jgi:hypothetical protein
LIGQYSDPTKGPVQFWESVAGAGTLLPLGIKRYPDFSLGDGDRFEVSTTDHPQLIFAPAYEHGHEPQHGRDTEQDAHPSLERGSSWRDDKDVGLGNLAKGSGRRIQIAFTEGPPGVGH